MARAVHKRQRHEPVAVQRRVWLASNAASYSESRTPQTQCLDKYSPNILTQGINLVTYYATTVFESSLQFDGKLSRFMTAWLGTEYFIAACLALFVVDRFGRRNLMIFGAAGLALSLLIIGASLSQATDTNRKPAIAATVFIFVYDTAFAIGWLGVTWLYPAEITPIRIRTETNGFSTCSNWYVESSAHGM